MARDTRIAAILAATFLAAQLVSVVSIAQTALTRDELSALMSGANIQIVYDVSFTWINATDGTLESFTWRYSPPGGRRKYSGGKGNWKISDDGRYCVTAGWKPGSTPGMMDWCRQVVARPDGTYTFSPIPGLPASTMSISRP